MEKIKIPALITFLSAIIFYLENINLFSIGKIINKYYPCEQKLGNSFPCFGIYDISFMFLLAVIFVVSAITIIFTIYRIKKGSNVPPKADGLSTKRS
ncbi:hypothetical protein KKC45_02075 [Patescibacteria group bacterium]|nr:hypothetical protein [Patescibacteria group bacterium]